VLGFRKSTGLARTSVADRKVFAKLAAGAGRFHVRYPRHGRHVEADLSKQVIALIGAGAKVERIYPMSSGKPSTPTILGSFRFYSKTPGINAKGMVFSNYFIRGYAIHGYAEVPVYPASHGCLRVPVPDAVPIYRWVRLGERIDVYR
jgi:lipoprotein-anchoring transpeptidase ErfK/SrfK